MRQIILFFNKEFLLKNKEPKKIQKTKNQKPKKSKNENEDKEKKENLIRCLRKIKSFQKLLRFKVNNKAKSLLSLYLENKNKKSKGLLFLFSFFFFSFPSFSLHFFKPFHKEKRTRNLFNSHLSHPTTSNFNNKRKIFFFFLFQLIDSNLIFPFSTLSFVEFFPKFIYFITKLLLNNSFFFLFPLLFFFPV